MPLPKKDGVEAVGMRLHKDAIRTLKIIAAERGSNVSALTQEALAFWWKAQPEFKTRGPLFPGEPPSVAVVATPEASKSEQSTPKIEEKAAPTKAAGGVTKVSPLAKRSKK